MKKISSICMAAILLAGISSAVQPARAEAGNSGMEYGMQPAGKPKKELKTVTFSVNMHCEKCVEKIRENISYEKGVKGLEISLEDKTVKIVYDPKKTDVRKLGDAISGLGYEVEVKE